MEQADVQDEVVIDPSAGASALEKLLQHPEPQARFMRTAEGKAPAYNVQTAVDAEHALIVVQQVTDEATDNRSLQPMAEAAQAAVGEPVQTINVVADAGYSNGDRKSTRLNSSHLVISYAVFCLKKKKKKTRQRGGGHSCV